MGMTSDRCDNQGMPKVKPSKVQSSEVQPSEVQPSEIQPLDYDIVIVGGGMVGSMLAAALATQCGARLRVAILESAQPSPLTAEDPYDLRVSALSIASENMLKAVGAWPGIVARRFAPFRFMQVWDGEQGGNTMFDSTELGYPHLGCIVENRVIQLALHERLSEFDSVDILCPEKLLAADVLPKRVEVRLESGKHLSTGCLIGADGARSRVRELAAIAVESSQYPQKALVATVQTSLPQQDITWQRFLPTGPQALLPLAGHRASMVWYHSEEEVDRLQSLPETEFLRLMEAEFPEQMGSLDALLGRGSFPLFKSHATHYVKERIALIGDAAHTVHPLAGQGVNLGLLDAAVLAEVVSDVVLQKSSSTRAESIGEIIGRRHHLRRYERWRRTDNALMIQVLDGFYEVFKPRPRPLRVVRSMALDFVNRLSPARGALMQYAMGVSGDLPRLAISSSRTPGDEYGVKEFV